MPSDQSLPAVYIASPALGSAGELIKKISYGIALPGLWISAVLSQHVRSHYMTPLRVLSSCCD